MTPARTKFNAVPAIYAGERYDSSGEAEYAQKLDARQAAGQITEWRRGEPWTLLESPTGRPADGITMRPDFEVWRPDGSLYVLDFKGAETREFRLKVKLWKAVYPGVPFMIVKADGREVPA